MTHWCNDYGDREGCLGEADERYTMRFDDIGEEPIYWCAFCGPTAHAMEQVIATALQERGPAFQKELTELIEQALAEQNKVKH